MAKKGSGSSKGSAYEREMCKAFSLWWTGDEREDVFWRTSGSGARAKVRGRAGADTAGQHGDIGATDPIGKPLIDLFTIEIKRGYSAKTVHDLIDHPAKASVQEFEQFILQTLESHWQARSFAWLLITRRDRRLPLIWVPHYALKELRAVGAFRDGPPWPSVGMRAVLRHKGKNITCNATGMPIGIWFDQAQRKHVEAIAKKLENEGVL